MLDETNPIPESGTIGKDNKPFRTCDVCQELITDDLAHSLNHRFHDACLNCEYCGNGVQIDYVIRAVKAGMRPAHPPCRDKALDSLRANADVIIKQKDIDAMNIRLGLFRADLSMTIDYNQQEAVRAADKWIHELDLDNQVFLLKRLEAVCAHLHVLIGRKSIDKFVSERDKQSVEAAHEYREHTAKAKEVEKAKKYRDKSLDATLDKAVRALTAIGYSKESAIEFIQQQKANQKVKP